MKHMWFASYDLDGSFEIYNDNRIPKSHCLGPSESFSECKERLIKALQHCKMELQIAIEDVRKTKKSQIEGVK